MTIDSIQNGVVLDHIQAGKAMLIYRLLELERKVEKLAALSERTALAEQEIRLISEDMREIKAYYHLPGPQ